MDRFFRLNFNNMWLNEMNFNNVAYLKRQNVIFMQYKVFIKRPLFSNDQHNSFITKNSFVSFPMERIHQVAKSLSWLEHSLALFYFLQIFVINSNFIREMYIKIYKTD